jgi:hypothetical protein
MARADRASFIWCAFTLYRQMELAIVMHIASPFPEACASLYKANHDSSRVTSTMASLVHMNRVVFLTPFPGGNWYG